MARAPKPGLTATIEQRQVKIGDRQVDAFVRIGRDRKTRVYAAEVKKGLRPATLGAMLHQIEVAVHLLDDDDFDYEVAGAWLAGYDAAQCIDNRGDQPHRVLGEVERILLAEADPDGNLRLVGKTGAKAPTALRLLGGFREGIMYVQDFRDG